MDKKITKRLSRDTSYTKKKKSYQETLSPAEIKKKLEEYKQVDDITKLEIGVHLRYFTINKKTGEKQFRLGGFLSKMDPQYRYIILQNGTLSWSVQLENTVLFQKMTFSKLKEEIIQKVAKKYEKKLQKLEEENNNLKSALKEIKKKFSRK
jgi:hypothetical protein